MLLIIIIFLRKKERNVLFNDALNTFIYGYMASEKKIKKKEKTQWGDLRIEL